MIKTLPAACILSISLVLFGCGGGSSPADDHHHEEYIPELHAFDIIDSYDVDTAAPNHPPLKLSPYLYDGLYEIFWDVNSLEDYTVSLRINDRPTLDNSLVIHSQVCGAGRRCDQSGNWVCEYTSDFYMSCDGSASAVDIYPLIGQVPQKVYMLIEVCDTNSNYCEFDYYPVTLE